MSIWDKIKMEVLGVLRFQPTGLGIISKIEYDAMKYQTGAETFSDVIWGISESVGKTIDNGISVVGDTISRVKNYLIFGLVFLALFFIFREFWRVKSAVS